MAFSRDVRKRRILLAGLFHETNTFASGRMHLDDFSIQLGKEIFESRGDASPMGAFLEEAEKFDWEIVPTIEMRATPGPFPEPHILEFFLQQFEARVSQETQPFDAVALILHGAMCLEGVPDVEGKLLSHIRSHPKLQSLPVFGVLDLHANFTQAMAEHSNALLVYRENPHTDAAETARRMARLLAKSLEQDIPLNTTYVSTNIIWPPTGTGTADRPMRTLEALARSEERDGIFEINVFAGFAHADTPDTGVSFSIVYDPRLVSTQRLEDLAGLLRKTAEEEKAYGLPFEWDIEDAIDDALSKGLSPCCLVEPADNIGGGAPGDGTMILRALLQRKIVGAGIVINDPEAVDHLKDASIGKIYEVQIGGRGFSLDPGPVPVKACLLRRSNGQFTLEDRQSHLAQMGGAHVDMGPCALLDVEGISILLTSNRTPPMDLGQWRSQGVTPESLTFIGIKAAVAHRRAYDPISKASYTVRTQGPCASDLQSLPYQQVRRPIFPLDF